MTMPIDQRKKDTNWSVASSTDEVFCDIRDGVFLAVLMDIRDELKKSNHQLHRLNDLFYCKNFLRIPTAKRRKKS